MFITKYLALALLPLIAALPSEPENIAARKKGGCGKPQPPSAVPPQTGAQWARIAYGPGRIPCYSDKRTDSTIQRYLKKGDWWPVYCQDENPRELGTVCGNAIINCGLFDGVHCCIPDAYMETGYYGNFRKEIYVQCS